jgi:hypothetical protein
MHCEAVGRPYDSVLRTYFGAVSEFGESVQTREEHFRTWRLDKAEAQERRGGSGFEAEVPRSGVC